MRFIRWIALTGMALSAYGGAQADTYRSKVIRVSDGDTVEVFAPDHGHQRIRLASIDAPETGHGRCRPAQPFAQKSREKLSQLVAGKEVELRCFEADKYQRLVCDLHAVQAGVVNKVSVNEQMVEQGLAFANRANGGRYLRSQRIDQAESVARQARLGIWAIQEVSVPWDWRREKWDQPGCSHAGA